MLVLDPGGRSTHVLRSAVGKGQIRKHRLQTSPNMSDPILIGSEVLAGSRPDDSYTQACSRTRSVWPKPDIVSQNPIGSGLVLHNNHDPGRLWKYATVSGCGPVAFC